ncbi:MAG TPA: hypothetical protein VKZ65_01760 [Glycomyces sp.]|nr:hypothetical protein [Glycomyces sp.]
MNDDEQIVRAAVAAPAQLPEDVMDRLGDERVTVLLSAATAAALRRRFRTSPERAAVVDFTEELHSRFASASSLLKPIVIEALVGFAFGDGDLADGLSPDDLRTALLVLPYAVLSEERLEGESLDRFVTEVLQSVYASEE